MRRVRSQLNNLAAAPSHTGMAPEIQRPLGYNPHTDEIQRRIAAMGVQPDHYAQNPSMEQSYASAMHQGNVMPNQPPYPMHNNGYTTHAAPPPQQHHAPYPPVQPSAHPQPSIEMDNIKASLERLTNKLQGLSQNQSGQTVQHSHLQQATSQITEQYQSISSEMKEIAHLIANLTTVQANNKSEELGELKQLLAQQQEMFKAHMASTQESQIDPDAYATAVEVSHAGITNQVEELRSALNSAFSDLHHESASKIESVVNQTLESQTEILHRVEQFESNLNGNIVSTQNDIIEQISAMQKSVDALENKSTEQYVLDTSSLDLHLEEINRAIVALSSADKGKDNLERIEARISDLGKMLDDTQRTPIAQAPGIDTDAIFAKFDSMNSAIAELGNNLDSREPGSAENIDGLAAQINKLSEKLDNISALQVSGNDSSSSSDNSALLERLDQLVGRVETIEAPAFDESIFSSIQEQIGDMSTLIKTLSNSNTSVAQNSDETDAVMEQLKYISSTVYQISLSQENGEEASSDPAAISALSGQIGSLSEQITNLAGAGFSDEVLSSVTERLTGIEQQLSSSRDIAIEVATQAAQEAVQSTVSQIQLNGETAAVDMTPIQQLSEQVQYLKEANDSVNTSNIDTMDTVKDIFSMMAERLSNIESQVMQSAGLYAQSAPVSAVAETRQTFPQSEAEEISSFEPEQAIEQQEKIQDTFTEEAYVHTEKESFEDEMIAPDVSQNHVTEPSVNISPAEHSPDIMPEKNEMSAENSAPEGDMPIEPGTGGPDLALLVRQAKERRSGMHPEMQRASSGGNQFRQIAKDAMRISEAEEDEDSAKNTGILSGQSGLSRFVQGNKKALIIGAAALLIVALTIPLATRLLSGGTQTVAAVEEVQSSAVETEVTPVDDTLINSSEELSKLQSGNGEQPIEENLNLLSEPVLADASEAKLDEVDEVVTNKTSVENPLFATEATSTATGFGVEASPVSAEVKTEPLPDLPFGNNLFKAAVANEDPKAFFEVAKRYTEGAGVEKNLEEAAKWYERAANLGLAPAQYIIGNFNEKGIGLERNPEKAATWYETAANNGNVIAMHNLAVLYATPAVLSEQPDMATAFQWFKKAAAYGVRDSQVNAGIFHTNGAADGKTDLIEAYKWFAVAGVAGDKDALSKRDVIGNAMRPDQLEQAKQLAKDWKPAEIDRDANEVKTPDDWKDTPTLATAAPAINKSTVKLVQSTLSKLGFDAGPADGVMGRRTRDAISAFQKKVGMPQNGQIDPQLVKVLKQVSA